MTPDEALQLADSCLILSQRLGQWAGVGPAIEEDMASINTALDLLGHARMWYAWVKPHDPQQRSEDAFAYWREQEEFKNLLLVELPHTQGSGALSGSAAGTHNHDYAVTVMRQFLFDVWHFLRLQGLEQSADEAARAVASKAFKEVSYHVRRSCDLVVRLGDGTDESHARMQGALEWLWPYTGEMFALCPPTMRAAWLEFVEKTLTQGTLTMPSADAWMHKGITQGGKHTEHLSYVLDQMQSLARRHPGAVW